MVSGSAVRRRDPLPSGWAARTWGYDQERRNQEAAVRREDPSELLLAVHRVSSLPKQIRQFPRGCAAR